MGVGNGGRECFLCWWAGSAGGVELVPWCGDGLSGRRNGRKRRVGAAEDEALFEKGAG